MKNKRMRVLSLSIFLMLVLSVFVSMNVVATESTIDSSTVQTDAQFKTIVVRSDGVMFAGCENPAGNYPVEVFRSDDSGATWVINKSIGRTSVGNDFTSFSLAVDKDDTVHLLCTGYSGGSGYLYHYSLNVSDSWDAGYKVFVGERLEPAYGCDIAFDSENMYIVWAYKTLTSTCYLRQRAYNFVLETWGTTTTLRTATTSLWNPSIVNYNNDLYVFYVEGNNIKYAMRHNHNQSWTYQHSLVSSSVYIYKHPKPVIYDNCLYVFYEGNSSSNDMRHILYKKLVGSWSSENVVHSDVVYDQIEPTVSVNSNGKLNVVWSGKSSISSSYYQLRQRVYSVGSWGSVAYVSSGAINKRNAHLCYQDYPTFTWLTDGVCVAYMDDTNSILKYVDSGSLIWYSGDDDPGSDPSSDYLCFGSIDKVNQIQHFSLAHAGGNGIGAHYVEMQRNVKMSCVIKELYLLLPYHFYIQEVGAQSIYLSIKGTELGACDEYTNEYVVDPFGDSHTMLKWSGLGITLDDERPAFELEFPTNPTYDFACVTLDNKNGDIDSDGRLEFKAHDNPDLFGDGIYNGEILSTSEVVVGQTFDLYYKCCYMLADDDAVYTDSITLTTNSIGFHDTLGISYTANLSAGNTYLTIDDADGVEMENRTCIDYDTFYYNPTNYDSTPAEGTYIINLTRASVVQATKTFVVSDDAGEGGANYQIWMTSLVYSPNEFTSALIYYRYNSTFSGSNGYINIKNVGGDEEASWFIDDTDWSIHTISGLPSLSNGEYTVNLYRYVNGTLYFRKGYDFNIESTQGGSAYLNIAKTMLEVGENQTISGYHNLVGFNVYVKIRPTNEIIDVSGESYFDFQYTPPEAGDYYVYLYHDDALLITQPKTFTVVLAPTEESRMMENIIGFGIIIALLCVGVGIMSKMKQESAVFIPLLFALIGTIISTVLGYIPMYVLYTVGLIVVAMIVYWIIGKTKR